MSKSSDPRGKPDPFELWRQIYETNERAWNAVLERTVNNPSFAESSGKIMETFLAAQKTVRDNMRSYLEAINVPTREDHARLGELIVALEEKIDQLDDRLARIESALSAIPSSAATEPSSATGARTSGSRRGSTRASSSGGAGAASTRASGAKTPTGMPAEPAG
jgi:ribosomal protein L12E/L44/L45/RPP1/RPP2